MHLRTEKLTTGTPAGAGLLPGLLHQFIALCSRIPNTLVAFVARFSIAAVFWKSGQTKIQGFAVDIVNGELTLGWPRLSDSVVDLFRDAYPTHGTWAAVLLYLMVQGPGKLSLDHWIARRYA